MAVEPVHRSDLELSDLLNKLCPVLAPIDFGTTFVYETFRRPQRHGRRERTARLQECSISHPPFDERKSFVMGYKSCAKVCRMQPTHNTTLISLHMSA